MPTPPGITAEAPLDLFGGLDTEIAPPDCPNGISPSCGDVEFTPGSVRSRRALRRLYPARAGTNVLSVGAFWQPNGEPLNIILYSDGELYQEDVVNSPGTITRIASLTPGCRCKMVNAFGRVYMAFSDGKAGTDVPRQYDGTNFDRLTQDGPGSPPSAADYSVTGTISSIAAVAATISTIAAVTDPGGTTATVTVTTSSAHGLLVGQVVQIVGVTCAIYNGEATITGVPSTTTFNYTMVYPTLSTNAYGRVSNVAELAFGVPHNAVVGDVIAVVGNSDSSFNGIYTITAIPSTVQLEYANSGSNTSGGGGATVTFQSIESSSGGQVVSAATITMASAPANVQSGDTVQISGSESSADSTYPYDSNVGGNPATWTVTAVSGTSITISIAGIQGLDGSNGSTTGGAATFGGLSSSGQYKMCVLFQTRNGFLTKPSPPATYSSLGNQKVHVTDLPIGPSNVVARVLAFTAANGSNFFIIPATVELPSTVPGGDPVIISSTVVPDNSSTSAILTFSDNALLAATGIDVPGNNLFNQATVGPCVGVSSYASRLAVWGDPNLIPNLLNMGFDGGYITSNVPTGWTKVTSGGALVTSGVEFGFGWKITGDGTTNAIGQISQSVYQDYLYVPILAGGTQYSFRCWLESSAANGDVYADIYSASDGVLATATFALSGVSSTGKFYTAEFSAATPAQIPSDAVLRVYAKGQNSGDTATIDECEIFPTAQPLNALARLSYVDSPESFDSVTGQLGSTDDPTPIQCMTVLRGTLRLHTLAGRFDTNDSPNNEPGDWNVTLVSSAVGALSPWSADAGQWGTGIGGEEWGFTASTDGLYVDWGSEPQKISQEIQTIWNSISWDYRTAVWVQTDLANRRVFVGLPLNGATEASQVMVMDFRELNTAQQIAESPPVHISFTGKMIASDLTRKWAPWYRPLACGGLLALSLNLTSVCFGGGSYPNPSSDGYGNAYQLGAYYSTDDDYGQISPFYWTYGFVSREEEQQLQVGGFLKDFPYATLYASGVGTVAITPATDNLANVWPPSPSWPLSISAGADIVMGLAVTGERCFFKVASSPASGTDNGFLLQKMVVGMRSKVTAPAPMVL